MLFSLRSMVFSALLVATAYAGEGEEPWEVAGIYPTPTDFVVWTIEKASCDEADPKVCTYGDDKCMDAAFMPVTGAGGEAALKKIEEDGDKLMEKAKTDQATTECKAVGSACTILNSGDKFIPDASLCYRIMFDENQHTTTLVLNTKGIDNIAAFTAHGPKEFERDNHYLKDPSGNDVEPDFELGGEPAEAEKAKPWGVAIGAAVIVNFVTLIGVVFLVPFFKKLAANYPEPFTVVINAFAAGAILAAGFYLMMYEATHLIKPKNSTEPEQIAYWGSMILLGFLTAYIVELIASGLLGLKSKPPATSTSDKSTAAIEVDMDPSRVVRVRAGVLIGDFMHNLADGVFIAFAFMGCGSDFGWTVTGVTVGHEIAQELADYLILTDPNQGNMKPVTALILNFVSGISVILGVIVLLGQGEEDSFATGMLLAYGGGVYLQIGAADAMPRAAAFAKSATMRAVALFMFVFGAAVIGVVLTNHEHCAPEGGHAH